MGIRALRCPLFLAFLKEKAGALPRPPLLGGTKSGCAPTETEPVRKSNRVQPDFCPRCPTHGDQRDKKETPECPHADIPLPTFRCARLLRLVLASLVTPPPILTHTGVFWRTPTPPKKGVHQYHIYRVMGSWRNLGFARLYDFPRP